MTERFHELQIFDCWFDKLKFVGHQRAIRATSSVLTIPWNNVLPQLAPVHRMEVIHSGQGRMSKNYTVGLSSLAEPSPI
jgi:hypothetical protein